MLIRDICREKRDEKKLTAQQLADETGIPLSTVNNYFASTSKAPSVYTVGPICKALGVSMDDYFGIVREVPDVTEQAQAELRHRDEIIEIQQREITELRKANHTGRVAVYLAAILAVIVAIYFFHFDVPNPDWGFTSVMRSVFGGA